MPLYEAVYDPQRYRREIALYDDLRHRFDDPPWLVEAKLSRSYDPEAVVQHELDELKARLHPEGFAVQHTPMAPVAPKPEERKW